MIAHLRGRLIDNDGEAVVVEVGGVGYQVLPSAATLAALPAVGADVELHVHSHFVSDEPIRLYGFADAGERRLFQTLLSVQGVGPRVAPLLDKLAGPVVRDVLFLKPHSIVRRTPATVSTAIDGQVMTFEVTIASVEKPRGPSQPAVRYAR